MLQVAQAVLMPLLVNRSNVGPSGQVAIRQMMIMDNPFATPESPQEPRAQLPSGRSPRRRFEPADTASWRLSMLNSGNLSDVDFRRIRSAARLLTCRNNVAPSNPMHLGQTPSSYPGTRLRLALCCDAQARTLPSSCDGGLQRPLARPVPPAGHATPANADQAGPHIIGPSQLSVIKAGCAGCPRCWWPPLGTGCCRPSQSQHALQRLIPEAQRLVLPDSGHTALLEVRLQPAAPCPLCSAGATVHLAPAPRLLMPCAHAWTRTKLLGPGMLAQRCCNAKATSHWCTTVAAQGVLNEANGPASLPMQGVPLLRAPDTRAGADAA